MYGFTTTLSGITFDQALTKTLAALKAEGFGVLSDIDVQKAMKEKLGAEKFLNATGDVLGFTFGRAATDAEIPESVLALVEKRREARLAKRFAESDELRAEILRQGFVIEDSKEGMKVKRA